MILCISMLLMNAFDVIKKVANIRRCVTPFNVARRDDFFLGHTKLRKKYTQTGRRVTFLHNKKLNRSVKFFAFRILLSPYFRYVFPCLHNSANFLSSKCEF